MIDSIMGYKMKERTHTFLHRVPQLHKIIQLAQSNSFYMDVLESPHRVSKAKQEPMHPICQEEETVLTAGNYVSYSCYKHVLNHLNSQI